MLRLRIKYGNFSSPAEAVITHFQLNSMLMSELTSLPVWECIFSKVYKKTLVRSFGTNTAEFQEET